MSGVGLAECGNTRPIHVELLIVSRSSPGKRVEFLGTGPLCDWRGLRAGQRIRITTTRGEAGELRGDLRAIVSVILARGRSDPEALFELTVRVDDELVTGAARGCDTADSLYALAQSALRMLDARA